MIFKILVRELLLDKLILEIDMDIKAMGRKLQNFFTVTCLRQFDDDR